MVRPVGVLGCFGITTSWDHFYFSIPFPMKQSSSIISYTSGKPLYSSSSSSSWSIHFEKTIFHRIAVMLAAMEFMSDANATGHQSSYISSAWRRILRPLLGRTNGLLSQPPYLFNLGCPSILEKKIYKIDVKGIFSLQNRKLVFFFNRRHNLTRVHGGVWGPYRSSMLDFYKIENTFSTRI